MAALAAIWIALRVIAWNSPANMAERTANPVVGVTAHLDRKTKEPEWTAHALPALQNDRPGRVAVRHYRSVNWTAGATNASPIAARPVAMATGLPWQQQDEVRRFFLQAAFTGSGAVRREGAGPIPRFPDPSRSQHGSSFTAYVWIYARQHSGAGQVGSGRAGRSLANGQYGGSQAGAILSYRLSDRPVSGVSLYGRLSSALAPFDQQEFAFGTRVRPMRTLPVAVHAEQRFDARSGDAAGTAIFVTGGTGPDRIVEKLALETYAQAGYVLGDYESYFFDGSAMVQRPIAEFDGKKLTAGAAVWAGGQRGISRLDIGPRVSFDLPQGLDMTRIAIDGRVRVAGNARPGSGAAVTLSTGF